MDYIIVRFNPNILKSWDLARFQQNEDTKFIYLFIFYNFSSKELDFVLWFVKMKHKEAAVGQMNIWLVVMV